MARGTEGAIARPAQSTRRPGFLSRRARASDESGQILVITALALVLMICCAGLVVDVGHAMLVQRQLQAGVDAAALAAVQDLPDPAAVTATAHRYSAERDPGVAITSKNSVNTIDNAETQVQVLCIVGVPGCNRRDGGVNGVKVRSTSTVPTWFGRIIGIDQMRVSAAATACAPCAVKPLDIMLVLDRTGSMCQDPVTNQNRFPTCAKLDEAKQGVRRFIELMDPSLDRVGLALFPPVLNESWVSSCPNPNFWSGSGSGRTGYRPWTGGDPASTQWANRNVANGAQGYNYDGRNYGYGSWYPWWDTAESRGQDSNRYVVAELEGAGIGAAPYVIQTGQTWQLNPASNLIQRIGCTSANGTTSYHLALESAQHQLNNSGRGRPEAQNVIVFLSDGAANTMPTNIPSTHWSRSYLNSPCTAGVVAADQAKSIQPASAATIIYTIGYGLDAAGNSPEPCRDSSGINADTALLRMASSPLHYYRVGATADLEAVFRQIAYDLAGSRGRLIDNNSPLLP